MSFADRQLAQTDVTGALATKLPALANWATDVGNKFTRGLMQKVFRHQSAGRAA